MKRFHVHVAVTDIPTSVQFYSKLFGRAPSKQKTDYAKWVLDDPGLNFAISARGHSPGLDHFGMQAETGEELAALKAMAEAASGDVTLEQGEAACCYARSEKYWTLDPEGIAWEHFLSLSDAETFGDDASGGSGACCIPLRRPDETTSEDSGACCVTNSESLDQTSCCA